jgi:ribosomal-protein-alanine N-acetyltransferase
MICVLESERMIFRPHRACDLEAYCALETDANVRRYVGGAPRTRADAESKFRDRHLKAKSRPLRLMATILKAENRYIGYSGLYRTSELSLQEAMLAFYFAPSCWGRGLASEAGRTFVAFGFGQLRLQRIAASVEVDNAASIRVLEKLGFSLIRTENAARGFYHFELRNPS